LRLVSAFFKAASMTALSAWKHWICSAGVRRASKQPNDRSDVFVLCEPWRVVDSDAAGFFFF
jgi:hypothetical protein